MKILKMTMFETDGAVENYIRPFTTDIRDTKRIVNDIVNSTGMGRAMDTSRLARTASGILIPSTDIVGSKIENGWAQARLMFAMAVQASDGPLSGNRIHYITGYTDHNEYTERGGNVDFPKDMRFYFNSVTKVDVAEMASRGQRVYRPIVRSNDLMLLRDSVETRSERRRRKPFLLRPSDVMSRSSSANVFSGLTDDSNEDVSTVNLTGVFNLSTSLSSRANNDSVEYLSKVMTGYVNARSHHNDPTDFNGAMGSDLDEEPDLFGDASERVRDSNFRDDGLFSGLKRFSDIVDDGFITWGQILKMDPEFNPSLHLPFRPWSERVRQSQYTRGDQHGGDTRYSGGLAHRETASAWHSNTNEALCASMIANALPSLMIKSSYSRIDGLVLDTDPQFDDPHVHIGTPQPYIDGIPIEYGYTYFVQYLKDVILPNISKNGLFRVEALIHANVDQDIEIYVTIDGGPEEYFIFPAWAGHLIPPIITDREEDVNTLATGIGALLEEIGIKIDGNNSRDLIDVPYSPSRRERTRSARHEQSIDLPTFDDENDGFDNLFDKETSASPIISDARVTLF